MTETLTLLLTVVLALVGFYIITNKKEERSSEVAELQKTVRLLIERQQQPPANNIQYSRAPRRGSQSFDYDYQSNLPNSPPALSLNAPPASLGRTPSLAPMTPSSSKQEVPVDVYAEVLQLQEITKQLERRNRELNRQLTLSEVSNVVDVERKYGLKASGSPNDVKLTPSEVETLRAVYNLFDVEQKGTISTKEIQALHTKLGEPMTESEAIAATKELDQDGTGQVNFHQFLWWWYENHKGGKKSSKYTERFKLISAKLSDVSFQVDRVIVQDSGTPYTLEYRLNFYYKQPNSSLKQISPWHDIPLLRVGQGNQGYIYNMLCEIPKWTRAKFECATGEPYNPIKQDTQHGKLRYYKHGDIMFNYGFIPQTWEDPSYVPDDTGCPGDNDPIDVLDIGAKQLRTGEIAAVKVLGVLALIDDGETDWKIIAISISDPMASYLNDVDDVETHLPGAIKSIREYFRDYKSFSGKINSYALRAQAMPAQYARQVIEDTHQHWKSLHLVNKRNVISKDDVFFSSVAASAPVATVTEHPSEHPASSLDTSAPLKPVAETKEQQSPIEPTQA